MAITKTLLVGFASLLLAFLSGAQAQAGGCTGLGVAGFADKTVCCMSSCGTCGGSGCGTKNPESDEFNGSQACCPTGVEELGRSCSEYEPPCTGEDSTVGEEAEDTTTSDSESSSTLSVDDQTLTRTSGQSDAGDDDGLCSDGIVDGFDGTICCNSECSTCGGKNCKNNLKYLDIGAKVGAANCCMGAIFDNEVYCADNGDKAPCIL